MVENQLNNNQQYLPFEDNIAELDQQIAEYMHNPSVPGNADTIRQLQKKQTTLLKKTYSSLSPWQSVQVSRHPQRPLFGDYLNLMVKEPRELHGDRCFSACDRRSPHRPQIL